MVKTWLYISITAVQVQLAHLLEVPTELSDTRSQGLLGLICPMPSEHCSPRVGSSRWGHYMGPGGTRERHPQCWVGPALLSFICQKPGASMGFELSGRVWAGVYLT